MFTFFVMAKISVQKSRNHDMILYQRQCSEFIIMLVPICFIYFMKAKNSIAFNAKEFINRT